ncbi:MAG: carboxy terminal-processing peptidase [Saprospiraceae bacterium]|nr:carboxy terminal-processing peptidase [Saprospiraceae bacterium]
MKFRGPLFFSIVAIAIALVAFYPRPVENTEKDAVLMHTIVRYLTQLHYQPKAINDNLSEDVYQLYLERIDGGKRFLTQGDLDQLETYRKELDDAALNGTYEFFELTLQLIEQGRQKTQQYYRDALAQPFDYTSEESIQLDGKKRKYAKDNDELREFWYKYAKYETLDRLENMLEEQEKKDGEKKVEIKSFETLEKEARESTLELFDNWFERMNKVKRSRHLSIYLNTLTNVFDPHTSYLEPFDREEFDMRMSGKLEGIGARLQTDDDHTKVVDIVVGGPAWKGQELEKDDLILKVAQGDEEPVDVAGMHINDVVSLIRGKKGTEVRLTIRKIDGTEKEISIIRDVVELEETFAKSLIFDGATPEERIGYIMLPSFYADFYDPNGRFSSKDVANEIEKLKSEGVNGIILDLRNNGGGSLSEVVKMSGLFIEKGPIVQAKSRGQKPDIWRDKDEKVIYNGPLAVLVNNFSASASEILAASLQDYGRAIVVGSKSTFGKGTVQRPIDLDRAIRGYDEIKPLGSLKLTTDQYYRINGESVQLKGVVPDVILPNNYQFIKTGEREEEYPLDWTKIDPVEYSQNVYALSNRDQVINKSQIRIEEDPVFQHILQNAQRLERQREDSEYPLSFEHFNAMEDEKRAQGKVYRELLDDIVVTGITNPRVDISGIEADEGKKARNEEWIKSISKDVYLKETINVLHDMILLQ